MLDPRSDAGFHPAHEMAFLLMSQPTRPAETVRMHVLQRLAEQAMGDAEFRAVARHDLLGALQQFGYDLNETELALVLRFRDALAEAGVDLSLQGELDAESFAVLQEAAQRVLPQD